MFNGARVVGPAVAGILVAAIGEGWCFLLNGLSYIAVITGTADDAGAQEESRAEAFRDRATCWTASASWPAPGRCARLLLLLGVVSLSGVPYAVLMPVFAESILHGGARELGILMAASGLGALGGALSLAGATGRARSRCDGPDWRPARSA